MLIYPFLLFFIFDYVIYFFFFLCLFTYWFFLFAYLSHFSFPFFFGIIPLSFLVFIYFFFSFSSTFLFSFFVFTVKYSINWKPLIGCMNGKQLVLLCFFSIFFIKRLWDKIRFFLVYLFVILKFLCQVFLAGEDWN